MSEFVRVAATSEIPIGSARSFWLQRYEIAVFNVEGEFFALENSCPHQGGPIAEGWLEGPLVTCPWHAWCFDVRTGKMTLGDFAVIAQFDVRTENGAIYVRPEPREAS